MARGSRVLPLLSLLLAASGAAGLIHEISWARLFAQSLGNSLHSLAAVLVAFLGGLGLGAVAGVRLVARTGSPLRLYAILEGTIAAYGLLTPAIAILLVKTLGRFGADLQDGAPVAAFRLFLACLALAPLTVIMGATYPVVVSAAVRRGAPPGAAIARLYGWNTIGGAAGALCGSFALLPLLGTRLTLVAAAALNLLAALGALWLHRVWRDERLRGETPLIAPERQTGFADGRRDPPRPLPRMLFLAGVSMLTGTLGAVLQVGWTRIVTLAFGSSMYALGVTLGAYILGTGMGSVVMSGRLSRPGSGARVGVGAQWLVAVTALLLIPLLGWMPGFAAVLSSHLNWSPLLMIAAQFLVIFILLLPPTLAQGATFPALVVAIREAGCSDPGRAAGQIYAASTWGSVGGFVLAGFLLIPALGIETTLRAAAVGALVVSASLLIFARRRRVDGAFLTAIATIGLPLVLLTLPSWDREMIASGGFLYGPLYDAASGKKRLTDAMKHRGRILFDREGGEGLVTVRKSRAGIISLQINGKTEASTGGDMATQLLAAHLPLLIHPAPEKVLVIGLASGITLGAVERHPVRSVRAIEIAPGVIEAAGFFSEENGAALDDDRLEIVVDDARSWLLMRGERYDVITSQPSNPWVAGVANLFTEEFYRLVAERLREDGLFCQWIQAYRLEPDDLRGVVRSFLSVFPEASLWEESPGTGDYFLIGGQAPLEIDPRGLAARLNGAVLTDLRRAGVTQPADVLSRYLTGVEGLRDLSAGVTGHTDDNLYLEWRAPLSLFSDTLRSQVMGLNRHREPVLSILPEGVARSDPGLVKALAERARNRRDRLRILDSLEGADLQALSDPFVAVGIAHLRAGLYPEAAAALARAGEELPDSGTVQLLLGEAYLAIGLEAAAEVVLRETVSRHPGLAPAWNALGQILSSRGRTDEARVAFERALESAPDLAAARNNLGVCRLRVGEVEAAERAFREALEIDPLLAAAQINLGVSLKRQGDAPGAEVSYRAALDIDPLNTDARYNLATLLIETGWREEGLEQLREILRIDPSDVAAAEALQ